MPQLVFYAEQVIHEEQRDRLRNLLARLAVARPWMVEPPYPSRIFPEATLSPSTDDLDRMQGGGELLLLPPGDRVQCPETEARQLADVECLIAEIQAFSLREHVSFEFELDGVFVGAIDNGQPDRCLREGLLGEWRRRLEQSSMAPRFPP